MAKIPKISESSRLLQHTSSSASRKLSTMQEFPSAFERREAAVKSVSFNNARDTATEMRTGLEKAHDSGSELSQKKQAMTFDFSERIPGGEYFKRQTGTDQQKATLMAMKGRPPLDDIHPTSSASSSALKEKELGSDVWLNSIVGTEGRPSPGGKSGGQAMLDHAELVAKSRDKSLSLAAFDSQDYWRSKGFRGTDFEQREEGAPSPFPVMTKRPKPKI